MRPTANLPACPPAQPACLTLTLRAGVVRRLKLAAVAWYAHMPLSLVRLPMLQTKPQQQQQQKENQQAVKVGP